MKELVEVIANSAMISKIYGCRSCGDMAPVFTYESPGRQTYSFFVEEF